MNNLASDAKKFFSQLSKNNNKLWFDAHRSEYDENILAPAKELVMRLGEELQKFAPGIIADPRINKSIFRINRDIRFSKDKTPYKTHIAILLWEGNAPKMENPGFYAHISANEITVGTGLYRFPKDILEAYRNRIQIERENKNLNKIITSLMEKGYNISGEHYKRFPAGFSTNLENPQLLLHNGISAWRTLSNNLNSPDLLSLCKAIFKETIGLHKWLVELCT